MVALGINLEKEENPEDYQCIAHALGPSVKSFFSQKNICFFKLLSTYMLK